MIPAISALLPFFGEKCGNHDLIKQGGVFMKSVNIKCPYCGSRAFLRPASFVYGQRAKDPDAPLYVCAHYPVCNAYVAAHRKTRLPMGTLAGPELRRKRIEAHNAFERLWKNGLMSRKQAYFWLQAKLGLPEKEAHIGNFSMERCDQVIRFCRQFRIPPRKAA